MSSIVLRRGADGRAGPRPADVPAPGRHPAAFFVPLSSFRRVRTEGAAGRRTGLPAALPAFAAPSPRAAGTGSATGPWPSAPGPRPWKA